MAVHYPTADITKTTADTIGLVIASNDFVFVKDGIEIASLGTESYASYASSAAIGGMNVSGADITIEGTLISADGAGIDLQWNSNLAGGANGSSSNQITVAQGGLIVGESGIVISGTHNIIQVDGAIQAEGAAVSMSHTSAGTNTVINRGSISGGVYGGAHADGNLFVVQNHGQIHTGSSYGILASEVDLDLLNTGTITGTGTYGNILAYSADVSVRNHGTISGQLGMWCEILDNDPNATFNLVNTGLIEGKTTAILLQSYNSFGRYTATIQNAGTISGQVSLDEGHDLYGGTKGRLIGKLNAGSGDDTLLGGADGDHLSGSSGDDSIVGGGGGDTLEGSWGDDDIEGGTGDDLVIGGVGVDLMDGGEGVDILSYAGSTQGVNVNLATKEASGGDAEGDVWTNFERLVGSAQADTLTGSTGGDTIQGAEGDDTVAGGAGNDDLRGGAGNDSLAGGEGADLVRGGADNDHLKGGAGNDSLRGEVGNDTLEGGAGMDWLYGGWGADTFRFGAAADTPNSALRDRIHDFSQAQDDVIDLSLIDANGAAAGAGTFDFIEGAAFSGVAGQLRQQASGGNTLLLGDVNGDKVADFSILVTGTIAFVDADFIL
jgi:Ca2+-binding RTX toxin-like protein